MQQHTVARSRYSVAGVLVAGLLAASAASAQVASIDGSPHDLVDGTGQSVTTTSTLPAGTGICVFCHTPHGADTSASVPLWNKSLPDPASYTQYSSLGTVSLDADELDVGSVSLACLSCHDGTQAMDSVINVPGSGLAGDGTNTPSPSDLGDSVTMSGTPVPNLSTDLQDDHPISIQYAGGGCGSSNVACVQGDLEDSDFTAPSNATLNSQTVWWVDMGTPTAAGATVGTSGSRDKHDMLLYTRDNSGNGGDAAEPFVECGSCHDPHSASTQPVNFLRVDNDNSQLCLGCHVK